MLRRRLFSLLLFLLSLLELPCHHPRNGDRLDFLPNPFFFEKTIERGTTRSRSFAFFRVVGASFEMLTFVASRQFWN
jgi:hypothetical protein